MNRGWGRTSRSARARRRQSLNPGIPVNPLAAGVASPPAESFVRHRKPITAATVGPYVSLSCTVGNRCPFSTRDGWNRKREGRRVRFLASDQGLVKLTARAITLFADTKDRVAFLLVLKISALNDPCSGRLNSPEPPSQQNVPPTSFLSLASLQHSLSRGNSHSPLCPRPPPTTPPTSSLSWPSEEAPLPTSPARSASRRVALRARRRDLPRQAGGGGPPP